MSNHWSDGWLKVPTPTKQSLEKQRRDILERHNNFIKDGIIEEESSDQGDCDVRTPGYHSQNEQSDTGTFNGNGNVRDGDG
jgi:hypothetical protein